MAILILLLVIATVSGCCERLFYYPDHVVYSVPDRPYEAVTFSSGDGTTLSGWFFPVDDPKGTIVHCHGNAQNMTSHWEFARFLPERGFNLLVFDYRGYGESGGSPGRQGTIADARAAVEYALGRDDVDARRVGMFGQSIGGAIAIVVAAGDDRIRAVVIDSAFTSYRAEAAHTLRRNPVTWLLAAPLARLLIASGSDPIDHVGRIAPRPVLFIHGTADRLVPPEMTRRLHEAAGERSELWLVDGARHLGSAAAEPVEYPARIGRFFAEAFAGAE
ncbi:MAG: alpha/beta fold hydrolase [Planctomycetota bacterium]